MFETMIFCMDRLSSNGLRPLRAPAWSPQTGEFFLVEFKVIRGNPFSAMRHESWRKLSRVID